MKPLILLVDDEKNILEGLQSALDDGKYRILTAANARKALEILSEESVDLLISDLRMPDMDGLDLMRRARELHPNLTVILITAYGTIENAVEAMRQGAFDFLTKPFNLDQVELAVERALNAKRMQEENVKLREALDKRFGFEKIIGSSKGMKEIFETVRQVAPSRATVLIEGESGTGKELIARAIHQNSPRKGKPFVAVHCASLAEGVLESELFGHEKGAFTGAVSRKPGRFELADGGTLFLDEVSEIPLTTQVKLLRVLQERSFERVGGTQQVQVDVRVVTATNKNLEELVKAGKFREDLFYRLKVILIKLPPLRERREDIPLMVNEFIRESSAENDRKVRGISSKALELLSHYTWPGNVRELKNCIESCVVLSHGDLITPKDIPAQIRDALAPSSVALESGVTLDEAEKRLILRALKETDNNKSLAAKLLGISRRTLHRKLHEYKISPE